MNSIFKIKALVIFLQRGIILKLMVKWNDGSRSTSNIGIVLALLKSSKIGITIAYMVHLCWNGVKRLTRHS